MANFISVVVGSDRIGGTVLLRHASTFSRKVFLEISTWATYYEEIVLRGDKPSG
jgi:hypothetical protein